uniref:S-adenosyl-L-methionine-dependent methyltransferase n=1 Tax=Tanacetum cinerariifolium TaxID=118510 RepID=A0A6L2LL59_TANCI|nr:S-adenosyl-L-methionine-dependent methyltransferase [Tanacetum cinerariifolium]
MPPPPRTVVITVPTLILALSGAAIFLFFLISSLSYPPPSTCTCSTPTKSVSSSTNERISASVEDIEWVKKQIKLNGLRMQDNVLRKGINPRTRAQQLQDLVQYKGISHYEEEEAKNHTSFPCPGELLVEEHHSNYGEPWAGGRDVFEFLAENSHIAPESRVLEIGCGTLRVGLHFIQYLKPEHFHCLERDELSLMAALRYELPSHGLLQKRPLILKGEDMDFTRFGSGYTQEEGIDYDEVFAPIARIKAIRLFLAYASFKDFVVYQIDVKSAFLYRKIEKEVYVCQPSRFEDSDFLDRVYKVKKALYGLHQAPRAWYETLSTYLLDNGFQRGKIDKTLFIKRHKGDILVVQVYVDDIFGLIKNKLCNAFKRFTEVKTVSTPIETQKPLLKDKDGEEVDVHMYRSMIGSLMYLISSRPDIMFVGCACARYQVNPKVSHLHAMKRIFRYIKDQPKLGLWYPKDSPFDLVAYTNSDYVGASLDMKSTTGGCQFLGCRLISWKCEKQTVVANSTTKVEYVVASSFYGQVLWIQN